jgi:hypothetical protein
MNLTEEEERCRQGVMEKIPTQWAQPGQAMGSNSNWACTQFQAAMEDMVGGTFTDVDSSL